MLPRLANVVAHAERPEPGTDERSPLPRRFRKGRVLRDGHVLYWWKELLFAGAFYLVYSVIRNSSDAHPSEAFRHAKSLIHWERVLLLYHEQSIQQWALHFKPFIITANYFYGSLHFVVTIGTIIFLYRRHSNDYPLWRNTLAIATGLALIGFFTFPLMPPRLLPVGYHYVDTLAKYPTFWSFDSGGVSKISNQFAAMPSVHCCWAGWCACVLAPRLRRTWAKVLAVVYPFLTLTVIVVTANHYILDAVGGFTALALGYVTARALTRAGRGTPITHTA
jgi:hypothetical protein